MANKVYGAGLQRLADGTIDWDDNSTTTIKVALMNNSHTFNDDHDAWDDISANEVSGTGYPAGGVAVANRSVVHDTVNDRAELDGDNATFSSVDGFTAYSAVVYLDSGTPSTSYLIAHFDDASEFPVTANGGDITINWNAEGIVQLAST